MKKLFTRSGLTMLFISSHLVLTLPAAAQTVPAEIRQKLLTTKQGSIVELPGILNEQLPKINYEKIVLSGPQYIISDDPEYIRVPEAIALKEKVAPGTVRLYVYNVNGVKEPTKITTKIVAVIKNTGAAPMHIRMLKYSSQKPSTSYFQVGKQGLADYFAATPQTEVRTIAPGKILAIDPAQEKYQVKYDELVHGLYDFVIDQPGEISVVQTAPGTPVATALARASVLSSKSQSGAGRGLFGVSNYEVVSNDTIDTQKGIVQMVMADGEQDPWVLGREGTTGKRATLAGNYGVMYNVELKWKSNNGQGLALVTWNARSDNNQWCGGMANTMIVSKGKFKEGIIQLPSDRLITKKSPEAILVQVFPPAANGEVQTIHFTYSPPGASCLPTPLIFIPVDMK